MTNDWTTAGARARLEAWFGAAIAAADPVTATRRALDAAPAPSAAPAILALGKAAEGMARAAVAWLEARRLRPVGGLIVSHQPVPTPVPGLEAVTGDHPVPGERSRSAAARLGATIDALPARAPVMVLVSGGTSSLLAAPLYGITPDELTTAFNTFHALGLPIPVMNALRRQLTRWSGGRLAVALGQREISAWVISDVVDNDLAVIGSGPLVGGAVGPDVLARVLSRPDLVAGLPASVVAALAAGTPPDGARIVHHLVADRTTAAEAVVRAAATDGVRAELHPDPIAGDATAAGRELAAWIARHIRRHTLPSGADGLWVAPRPFEPRLHVWTGETTVTLPPGHGTGGRAQQLALVLARELAGMARRGLHPHVIHVLVAGTDGRDGPTDAAGAVVDWQTVDRMAAAGIDVDAAIARCDAYPALDAAGALVRTGPTGTNVADVILVLGGNRY